MAVIVPLLLAVPASAQMQPGMAGCSYTNETPQKKDVAERLMPLALPYLDKDVIHYRDDQGGGYAIRRSLRIYFYDAQNRLLGTAIRRSQSQTSYFGSDGSYLGHCTNHRMTTRNEAIKRLDPTRKD